MSASPYFLGGSTKRVDSKPPLAASLRHSGRQGHPVAADWSRGRNQRAALAAAVAAVVLFSTMAAPRARAGTYTIGDCPDAFNRTGVAGPWRFVGPSSGVTVKDQCAGGPEDSIFFAIPSLPTTALGFLATTAGSHLAIVHVRLWYRAFGSPSGEDEAELVVSHAPEELLSIASFPGSGTIVDQVATPEELSFPASEEATSVWVGELCYTANKCPMSESFGVGIQIFGAELTLDDEIPPTASITTIAEEPAVAVSGPVQTSFSASDPEDGVRKAELLVDGSPVATHDYGSSCTYTQLQACPATISDRLEVQGSALPEGTHQIAVRVTDTAGNTTNTAPETVRTAHTTITANGVPCPAPAITVAVDGKSHLTVPFGRSVIVQGRLGCGASAIPGASIDLSTQTVTGHTEGSQELRTAADGTFRYELAPGPSRILSFGYRAYSNEVAPTAQASVRVAARPKIQLHIRAAGCDRARRCPYPRRTHNGGSIIWRGRVIGGPYPPGGVPVAIQVWEEGRWQTFDEILAPRGEIAYRYTFRRTTRPTTYRFRVALPNGAVGYPYAPSASRGIPVRVL